MTERITHDHLTSDDDLYSIHFVERPNGPTRLVCDVEIHFHAGLLAGLKLVGLALWRSTEGDLFPTMPCRPFGTGAERKYFDMLRSNDEGEGNIKGLKAAILAAYREQHASRPIRGRVGKARPAGVV